MVKNEHMAVLEKILGVMGTAIETNLELLELFQSENDSAIIPLLDSLSEAAAAVRAAQRPLLPQLEHAYTEEMLDNVEDTLDDIRRSMREGNMERAEMKIEFQLLPFLRCLREAFYFRGAVYPDKEKMAKYYREDFARAFQSFYVNEDEPSPVQLSIVVTGYNHLETTKQCVEHLLRETDFENLSAELILIDHGSTDGTLEYFESLGVGKVIHFKKNARMNMFATLFQICQGNYFSFISNDILVTQNWAEILLSCLKSDEKIISAVPTTPNIANLQPIGLPELGPREFVEWAGTQNRSDPTRWNDRARLMPPLAMYRTVAVNRIGFADPYLYSMEYWDDDFSFRARRAGYRQVLCNDVACYHFGSVTGRTDQKKEGTLVYGRELFLKKNGIDAWGSGFCYDYVTIQLFQQMPFPQENISVLGLDCGMGDTMLQIRNERRHARQTCSPFVATCQKEYLPDLQGLFPNAVFSPDLAEAVHNSFDGEEFSFAFIGRDAGCYENLSQLLAAVSARLLPGGYLSFSICNPYYAVTLHKMLQFSMDEDRRMLAAPGAVRQMAREHFSEVQMVPVKRPPDGLSEFAQAHYGKRYKDPLVQETLSTASYYFVCRK